MAQIQRVLPPWYAGDLAGPHIFGEVAVTFDADGLADVTDPAVLELMQAFPETFHVVETAAPLTARERRAEERREARDARASNEEPPAQGPEAPPHHYSQAELEGMAVWELQSLAAGRHLTGMRTMRKQELIDAILGAQAQEG